MTQHDRTLNTIDKLSKRMLEVKLNHQHPDRESIINAYEIVIKELDKLLFIYRLHYFQAGTLLK